MRVVILSRSPRCYSTRRLREAARVRGHQVQVLDTLQFAISMEQENPGLLYRRRRLGEVDAVVPRIGASVTTFGTAVVRQFQQMGVFVANTANSIGNSRDKLRALQILSKHDIGIAPTMFVRNQADILMAIDRVGGAPVIIKMMQGTQGVGVILAESNKIAEAIVEAMQGAKQSVLIQKFVAESKGRDVRAFVVGNQVVGAMRRVAQGQEFRSNLHRGGKAEAIDLEPAYAEAAIRAAHILGLRIAGVDMLEGADGPQIIEVNSSPGLEGIEKATGKDIAGIIVDYINEQVAFPELDLRERMTVAHGHGVVEIQLGPHNPLTGQRIGSSGLGERDILVLTVERNGETMAVPDANFELLSGDRLLCFGDLAELRTLVPPKVKKRRRRI
ncbi:MAG TPA: RimK family alpha-L-glutamate ligase [Fimbriimonadaceae bacterium]|nr:30S ribosomal protein S6--L-glutamate ligase [Armatimonadota bacterium]HCM74122.1 30S ribosomal protein S6--L-glutamate ligase [Armatimonadota bacterium]HRD31088.1 RimK family alpha-L-glutamate ligase [Fimbriimonadaceae bacterium]HRE93478.1 RimK family alpha-L-glutamate ligase [Fimbriimonadaceae bacterium]HRI73913.1 RimK family alpha-L-glutamate ligase [Fimbriimonadaceae bacterium]